MEPAKVSGRALGVLLFIQLIGLSLPFILIMPIASANFLETAAPIEGRIRIAVLLLFANSLLTIWIGMKLYPILRERSISSAVWLLILGAAWLVLQGIDNAHILSMLSISQQYAAGSGDAALTAVASSLRSTRRFVHYTELLVIDLWFALFYGILFAFRLVPRPLALFGLAAVCVHASSITLPVLVGYPSVQQLGVSLALSHLALAGWLVANGFTNKSKVIPEGPA